jgi:hypothetical protein
VRWNELVKRFGEAHGLSERVEWDELTPDERDEAEKLQEEMPQQQVSEKATRKCKCACHTRKGKADAKAIEAEKKRLAAVAAALSFTFEGGASKGVTLARRVRRVSPAKQARLHALDARIRKLQRERGDIIGAVWGDGIVLSPDDLLRITVTNRKKPSPSRRTVSDELSPKFTIPGPTTAAWRR